MLRKLFNRRPPGDRHSDRPRSVSGPRVSRHSSAWAAMLKYLQTESDLRILDIGPTSPSNINFLTGLGHSVYMADIVHEALKPGWRKVLTQEELADLGEQYDTTGFLEHNLQFSGRMFDVVLLWTALDYLPEPMIAPIIDRFHSSMQPGGRILALFPTKKAEDETSFLRYHITDTDNIEMQESQQYPVQRVYTNRGIEKLFRGYSNYKFFLAQDNVFEVIITR